MIIPKDLPKEEIIDKLDMLIAIQKEANAYLCQIAYGVGSIKVDPLEGI